MGRINILYQCSNEYAFMAGVSIVSLLENADRNIEYCIYILNEKMSDQNRKCFAALKEEYPTIHFTIEFLDATICSRLFAKWKVPNHRGSNATYFKLLSYHFFKDTDVKQIIYIDADSLILGNLAGLVRFDFHGKPIALCWQEKMRFRHVPLHVPYHSGSMVYFNYPEWVKHNCEARIREHILNIGEIYGSKDEGIMNMEFEGEIARLPLKYNVYSLSLFMDRKSLKKFYNAPVLREKEIIEAQKFPQIVHVPRTFLYRPFEKGSKDPISELWWSYCNKSPWKGMKMKPAYPPLGAKEKLLRFLYLHLPDKLANRVYIAFRHGYGYYLYLTHLPKKKEKQ